MRIVSMLTATVIGVGLLMGLVAGCGSKADSKKPKVDEASLKSMDPGRTLKGGGGTPAPAGETAKDAAPAAAPSTTK